MLSESTIDTVKAITPMVAEHAETITRRFYERMFDEDPQVQAFFNQAHQHSGGQQRALAGAICAYFANIDNLDALGPAVEVIAQKHCSLEIQPEHYPIVGKHLLAAIREVMGEAANDDILQAVSEAYGVLADVCIAREQAIYEEQSSMLGGWTGRRRFVVDRKVPESEFVTSFYLKPQDGLPLPAYRAGQYITLHLSDVDPQASPRNYSLSDRPGQPYLRISVKRELGAGGRGPEGVVSTYLHERVEPGDVLQFGPPCGEFIMDADDFNDRPVVFLAGGIGVTPLLSMARHLVHEGVLGSIQFFQAAKNSRTHAFRDEVQEMVSDKDFVETWFVYDEPLDDDLESGRCDRTGRITPDLIRDNTPVEKATYFVCGPPGFMGSMVAGLKELGVDDDRIRFEFFGPRQTLACPMGNSN